MLDKSQIDIRTARLHLRAARDGDADALFPLFANWEVIRWLSSPPWPYRREDMQAFIARQPARLDHLVISLDATPIGVIGVRMWPANAIQCRPGPNIGYWLGQPYWGRGYMSEAARALIAHVFATVPDDAIYSGAFKGNVASLRVQEKLGFAPYADAMWFSRPHQQELPHINTVLSRDAFRAATA